MKAKGGKATRGRGPLRHPLLVAALGLLLAACASGPQTGDGRHSRYAVGRPSYKVGALYQVNGVWYYPRVDYNYDATGTASWYGEAFDGRATANGEIYDLNQLTAAHTTLPLPSIVEVTNLQNGRSLRLRVNDRGPYVGGRIVDVSRRAAQLLGFEGAGTTPVRVRILREESIQVAAAAMRGEIGGIRLAAASSLPRSLPVPLISRPLPAPQSQYVAPIAPVAVSPPRPAPLPPQPMVETAPAAAPVAPPPAIAAAPRRHNWPSLIAAAHAETLHPPIAVSRLPAAAPLRPAPAPAAARIFIQAGAFALAENAQRVRARIAALGSVQVVPASVNGTPLYRVRLGPVASRADADRLLDKVVGSGYPAARVVSE
jgi:rare lipoprotein A